MSLEQMFDAYSLQARLRPALFVMLPFVLSAAVWVPDLYDFAGGLTGTVAACGFLLVLSHIARFLGRRAEQSLLKEWGGWPSTVMLRHRDGTLDANTKDRYHRFLSANVTGLTMPSSLDENSDLESADQAYRSATRWLIEQTRDRDRFDILFHENISYGFRRNLYGLKPLGLLFSIFAAVWSLVLLYPDWEQGEWFSKPLGLAAFTFSCAVIFLWLFIVTRTWVRDAGYAYAWQLLASCDRLNKQ